MNITNTIKYDRGTHRLNASDITLKLIQQAINGVLKYDKVWRQYRHLML